MNEAVNKGKEHRVTGRRELHNPPDGQRKGDVMKKEIICYPVVALSQKENVNFREECEIVDEIAPSERHNPVCVWRFVKRLTSGKILFIFD